jgi:hypothetical protein
MSLTCRVWGRQGGLEFILCMHVVWGWQWLPSNPSHQLSHCEVHSLQESGDSSIVGRKEGQLDVPVLEEGEKTRNLQHMIQYASLG